MKPLDADSEQARAPSTGSRSRRAGNPAASQSWRRVSAVACGAGGAIWSVQALLLAEITFDAAGNLDATSGTLTEFEWDPDTGTLQPQTYRWTPPVR